VDAGSVLYIEVIESPSMSFGAFGPEWALAGLYTATAVRQGVAAFLQKAKKDKYFALDNVQLSTSKPPPKNHHHESCAISDRTWESFGNRIAVYERKKPTLWKRVCVIAPVLAQQREVRCSGQRFGPVTGISPAHVPALAPQS